MNVAAGFQSKMHSAPANRNAEMIQHGVASQQHAMSVSTKIDGELSDLPGQKSATMVTTDYGQGKHEAYDSPLAQPAYSGHGKVQTGKTSAL